MSNESNTVASLLTDLDESRSDIIDAVSEMGGTVSENARFSEIPAAVRTIQTGPSVTDGTGIHIDETDGSINHTNATTAFSGNNVLLTKYDAQGHIVTGTKRAGTTTAIKGINTAAPGSSAPTGTSVSLWTIDAQNETLVLNQVAVDNATSIVRNVEYGTGWGAKTWTGLTSFYGSGIWTDGENIYYSNGTTQYVLNKSTSTWSAKTWSGLTSFYGYNIWTDGTNIYCSNTESAYGTVGNYVLDKSTSTWSAKSWSVLTSFDGYAIWTDGEDIYYSNGGMNYVLNKSTSTWSVKLWDGLTFYGNNIWTDGENIYYSMGSFQYVLDKSTSTWSTKTWSGLTDFEGYYIWTDGENIYYSYGSDQYVLNKSTSTWSTKSWTGLTSFQGNNIWTDGENIYYSQTSTQYVLE